MRPCQSFFKIEVRCAMLAMVMITLLGGGCSTVDSSSEKYSIDPDFFQKKIECSNLRSKAEQRINDDFASRNDISFLKTCYSKKYNSCAIKFEMSPKDKDITLEESTSYRDVLTGELLKSINLFKKESVGEYRERIYQADQEVDCAE